MRKNTLFPWMLIFFAFISSSFGQNGNQSFKMAGSLKHVIEINERFYPDTIFSPFNKMPKKITGIAISGNIVSQGDSSNVAIILIDRNNKEYLIYENYELLNDSLVIQLDEICEETCILSPVTPASIYIKGNNVQLNIKQLNYTVGLGNVVNINKFQRERKKEQNSNKIDRINQYIKKKKLKWIAGPTSVSEYSYEQKLQLFEGSTLPPGIEYYSGGIIEVGSNTLKSASSSPMVDKWDWRDRHGSNWVSPVKNQSSCGSCWAFAATGATEARVNLYYNQIINLNLSEQDVLSCSGAGSCSGGYPSTALSYIASTGIVDEATFPYAASDLPCENKGTAPLELIKIGGHISLGSSSFPRTEDDIKKAIINHGPLSGGLYDWSHAMTLPGYQVVAAGDEFYYRDLNKNTYTKTIDEGDPLIGKTVWIFKNSWGAGWGDNGYVYVETDISNFGWTHHLVGAVQSEISTLEVKFTDNDGDGYYWWGLGEKPASCPGPDLADGDDSNPNLGPLDSYGNCMELGLAPIANFSSSKQVIFEGEMINFNDLSTNLPTQWSWIFEGGTPASSMDQNPIVQYNNQGTYDVTLIVNNNEGYDTLHIANYITVNEYIPSYCSSNGNATAEWISAVKIGTQNESLQSSGTTGYMDLTSTQFLVEEGQTYPISLVPGFNPRSKFEYWAVWIDYNSDFDFDDPGELVFTASKAKSTVNGTLLIPDNISGDLRMRISMSRNGVPSPCAILDAGEVKDFSLRISETTPTPPVANFECSATEIQVGGSITFSDLSTGNPASLQWSFEGGSPEVSSQSNPVITYNVIGTYSVELWVSNEVGSDSLLKTNYIKVIDELPVNYCIPGQINSTNDYIASINLGNTLSRTSGGNGYSLWESSVYLNPGTTYSTTLTPAVPRNKNFWRIWIDFNKDGDFDDSDETLVVGNNKRGDFITQVSIPSYASGETRMRVAMKMDSSPTACDDGFEGEVEDYLVVFSSSKSVLSMNRISEMNGLDAPDIYPNPIDKRFTILFDNTCNHFQYKLFKTNGQLIKQEQISGHDVNVDVQDLKSGIYFINITKDNDTWIEKLIKR